MYDITAIGELLIDFTPLGMTDQGKPSYEQNPGGAPGNVAVACAKLGGTASFIGKVGRDPFGSYLHEAIRETGVETKGLVFSDAVHTTLAFVHLSETGDRSFSFYRNPGADMMLTEKEIDHTLIEHCHFFHFGSVSLSAEPARGATAGAVEYAKKLGKIITYDVNYRAPLFRDEPEALLIMKQALPTADILKVSLEEMILLTGETNPQAGSMALSGTASLVVVSLGAQGAFYRLGHLTGTLPTYDVKTIDTTGAGDAFFGALLFRLKNHSLDSIRAMDRSEIEAHIDFANAAGALATTKKGAIPSLPSLAEVEQCRKSTRLLP